MSLSVKVVQARLPLPSVCKTWLFVPSVIGKEKALLDLSKERAQTIKRYLVYEKFIQPLRIEVAGYGGSKPLNDNQNEVERSKNRRVEFVITKVNHNGTMQTKQQK